MIIPVTFALAVYQAKKDSIGLAGNGFKLYKSLPWFVLAFLLASIINTTGVVPTEITADFGKTGRFLIIMAMTAIGLSTNLRELIKSGGKAVLLGFVCSVAVAVCSLLVVFII